jgi:hypothetical protein
MAKPNFQFQKRQKELERKKKNDEKLQRKLEQKNAPQDQDESGDQPTVEDATA